MIEISIERDKILRSLKELEKEFNSGNIPKSHYLFQKRQLNEQLETFNVADRVRKLQGKEVAETPVDNQKDEEEDEELFKKYITAPGLKKKNVKSGRFSQNKLIAGALLALAFIIGIGFGLYTLSIPDGMSGTSLATNDSAFPPFVLNNTTNSTNSTNMTKNVTKNVTTVKKPVTTPVTTPKTEENTTPDPGTNDTPPEAAGDPATTKKVKTETTPPDTGGGNTSNSSG